MNFFESQEIARKKTGRLIVLFTLAVLAIMFMVYMVVAFLLVGFIEQDMGQPSVDLFHPTLLLAVGLGTLAVVGLGSLYKIVELRAGGGKAVAEALGGRLVPPNTTDHTERRLFNVVEEMAIASGTPVPPVYILEEAGINAFAAGYSPADAVVAVTRGCAEQLSRDELQGVIAHEFSHVFNGDMRLNIRLMGFLHGILIIGMIGYILLRSIGGSTHRTRRSSRGKGDGGVFILLALGIALIIIGYTGTFFGKLIKAAVSRQREYLADASAVQFTRNPSGIAGALKRIGGFSLGSRLENPNAAQASHMFFSQGFSTWFGGVFATHPPLTERIRRIEPDWDGGFAKGRPAASSARETTARGMAPAAFVGQAKPVVAQIAEPTEEHIQYAGQVLHDLPEPLVSAAHDPFGARAVIYALLIQREGDVRKNQIEWLAQYADPDVFQITLKLLPSAERLKTRERLPLIDLTLPALKQLSPSQYQTFKRNFVALVEADRKIELFEWMLQRLVLHSLEAHFTRGAAPPRSMYYGLPRLRGHLEVFLSTLAYAGQKEMDKVRVAFEAGAQTLQLKDMTLCPLDRCGLKTLDAALDELARLSPPLKEKVLKAGAACIGADISITEAELFRAAADALGCPVPPLIKNAS
ncbi:MAG: M48 family metallopeptidase [Phycisphaerales bacterium]|nr:M48 family metallopeptidase [Phycisphaerales bacterium]